MLELLTTLCGAMGIPGREAPVMDIIEKELTDMDCRRDALGNLLVTVHPAAKGEKTLMIEAHADRIGFMVTGFLDDGFVRVTAAGGIDRHTAMGSELIIEGIDGPVTGIVGAPFPHPAKPHNSAQPSDYTMPEIDALYVDTGLAEPKKRIKIGAQAVFAGRAQLLTGDRVAAPALDNRLSCLALIEAAKRIKAEPPQNGVVMLFSTREESAGKTVSAGAFGVMPDAAIVVDTAFGRSPDTKPEDSSVIGEGPEIAYSGVLDAALTDKVIEITKSKKISCQTIVLGRTTGTDADNLAVTATGIPTAVVSIPIRYMHHPYETADLSDTRATVSLLVACAGGI